MQSRNTNNIKVIDVSIHQGFIDWVAVAADGVQGVLIKATEGVGFQDSNLTRNAEGAAAAGLKVGYYHYARPETGNNVLDEVYSFLAAIDGLPVDLPLVLDVEDKAAQLGSAKLTDWSYTWLTEIQIRSGHRVMLYTGASFARSYLGSKLGEFPLWVAHYGATTPMSNSTWEKWAVFQYSESERVAGIAGNVDMNEMDLAFWNEIIEVKQIEEVETNMPMKLEGWQWDMLYKVMGTAYNEDQLNWDWMQKIKEKTLTASELAFLNTVLDGRVDRGIEV
ncbi:glycoside hydrolase family 25 protein [Paenibacillus periandrae]|uniref:glycoside hydrolase family 25 protein n=1 Tax=Paenibacillus periandrae TaxID=1761741 RepID=UPI001F08A6B9|nr:glycoside hydrolase family 25 protein [Paenibacillus periandrae]